MGHRRRRLVRCPHGTSSQQTTFCPDLYFRLFTYTAKGSAGFWREKRGRGQSLLQDQCCAIPKLKRPSQEFGRKGNVDRDLGGIGGKAWTASILAGKVADPIHHLRHVAKYASAFPVSNPIESPFAVVLHNCHCVLLYFNLYILFIVGCVQWIKNV